MSLPTDLYKALFSKLLRAVRPHTVVSATGGTITAAQARQGAVVSNAGAAGATTWALPPAKRGMRITALVQAAQELRVDPNGTETIALPSTGVQGAAGLYMTANAIGETATWVCVTDGTWSIEFFIGTWTVQP